MNRCNICNERKRIPNHLGGKMLCDGCFCEYRAVLYGEVSSKRKKTTKKSQTKAHWIVLIEDILEKMDECE